jgi:hypothetical protein
MKTFLGITLSLIMLVVVLFGAINPAQAWQGAFSVRTEKYMLGSLISNDFLTTIEDRYNNVFVEFVHKWTPCGENVSQRTGVLLSSVDGEYVGTFSAYTVGKNEIYLTVRLVSGRTITYSITKNLQGDVYYANTLYVNNTMTVIKTRVTGQYCYCPVSTGRQTDTNLVTVKP